MDPGWCVHDNRAPKRQMPMCMLVLGSPDQRQLLRLQYVDILPNPLCFTTPGCHSAVCMLGQSLHGQKVNS